MVDGSMAQNKKLEGPILSLQVVEIATSVVVDSGYSQHAEDLHRRMAETRVFAG
jgi:hypothetical protein